MINPTEKMIDPKKLDVYNLNYDTWVEQSLIDYNDGYVDIANYDNMKRFDISSLLNANNSHSINHLHGQIHFEYPSFKTKDINMFAFQESNNTLYKYTSYEEAKKIRDMTIRSGDSTQSGENLFRTNIVTGLMKTDKLLWNPLNAYHMHFYNSLMNSNSLIIIGYGFGDLYINNLLVQFINKHYYDRKVIMIDYINSEYWGHHVEHPFSGHEKATYTNRLFKNDYWTKKYLFSGKPGCCETEDKMCKIYTNGFKEAYTHIDEIIELLK